MAVGLRASAVVLARLRLGDEPAGVRITEGDAYGAGRGAAVGRGTYGAPRSRPPRLDPLLADGLLALVAAGLSLAQLQGYPSPRDPRRRQRPVGAARDPSAGLPMARPVPGVAVVAAVTAVQGTPQSRGPLFAFLGLTLAVTRRPSTATTAAVRPATVWACRSRSPGRPDRDQAAGGRDQRPVRRGRRLCAAGRRLTLGEGVRQRRVHAAELEDRAARLEREREEKARQAVIQVAPPRPRAARRARRQPERHRHPGWRGPLVLDADPHPTRARQAVG